MKQPKKGRGATHNETSSRFNLPIRELDTDWLDIEEAIDGPRTKTKTTVQLLHPKTIISYNSSPDIGFDRSINPLVGCEHGCVYCYARPSHAFHDLSPGLDFETKLFAKPDAARLLRETLAKKSYTPAPIAMGTNTDPYQPIEGRYRITRQVLELCLELRHPVTITTKSARVLDDLDLLTELARHRLTAVGISVTSLDPRLSGLLEPRASSPAKRLDALEKLVSAGVPAHVSVAPIIPAITDHFIEAILDAAAQRGVRSASWIMLRLPHEVAPLFREWLETHFPDRAGKVMSIVQQVRDGKDNDAQFFTRMKPQGTWADLTRTRFRIACRKSGIGKAHVDLDCTQFVAPALDGQMRLL
ncbi:MAG: radical SAM protein [Novosphingobium sp. 17-62-19]|uniref:PA0069 family radical SAM protein n=1 Tax=Novosphingobium sp. 17-62-19 TaxID=1970406 RepID=UPI000BC90844|nr:PA0069 family radical SAM protein [Novosphingobium sp. 17-62-19]OYX91213.1 MAG: radical SAM protein [Novosphingobium sp. 35-62-5]OZA18537.1 MAG: radical SAM protein [Novosphingobium sp. 17-62-19]HQS97676.1 PA0069 family radical SAM protein [Novosphingobium sp.]